MLEVVQVSPDNKYTGANELFYSSTVKFHKVVQQYNSGAVEDFTSRHSAVYLRIQNWKHSWNQSTFAKVIIKNNSGTYFMDHGVEH